MAGVKLDTVRSGVKLLSGLLKAADNEMDGNGRVSAKDVKAFKDSFGDGGSMDAAMTKIVKYAQAKFGVQSPSITQLNQALSDAMKAAANADTNKSKNLSPTEQKALAATWKAVVEFAGDYRGTSVSDIVSPRGAP